MDFYQRRDHNQWTQNRPSTANFTLARSRESPRREEDVVYFNSAEYACWARMALLLPGHTASQAHLPGRQPAAKPRQPRQRPSSGLWRLPRAPESKDSEVLLPRVLILPDLKRAALALWRPLGRRIGLWASGATPAAHAGWRSDPQEWQCSSGGLQRFGRGCVGYLTAPLSPDRGYLTNLSPLVPVKPKLKSPPVRAAATAARLLQLEDKTALGASSVWNVLRTSAWARVLPPRGPAWPSAPGVSFTGRRIEALGSAAVC